MLLHRRIRTVRAWMAWSGVGLLVIGSVRFAIAGDAASDSAVPSVSKNLSIQWGSVDVKGDIDMKKSSLMSQSTTFNGEVAVSESSRQPIIGITQTATITQCAVVDNKGKTPVDSAGKAIGPELTPDELTPKLDIIDPGMDFDTRITATVTLKGLLVRPAMIKHLAGYVLVARAQDARTIEFNVADPGKSVNISQTDWIELVKPDPDPSQPSQPAQAGSSATVNQSLTLKGTVRGMAVFDTTDDRSHAAMIRIKVLDELGHEMSFNIDPNRVDPNPDSPIHTMKLMNLGSPRTGQPTKVVIQVYQNAITEKVPFEINDLPLP